MNRRVATSKYKVLFFFSVGLFAVSVLGRMYCSNHLVVKNEELRVLHMEKIELEKEISSLKYQDSQLSSLSYVESKALELGFVPLSESLLSLNVDAPLPVAALSVQ